MFRNWVVQQGTHLDKEVGRVVREPDGLLTRSFQDVSCRCSDHQAMGLLYAGFLTVSFVDGTSASRISGSKQGEKTWQSMEPCLRGQPDRGDPRQRSKPRLSQV